MVLLLKITRGKIIFLVIALIIIYSLWDHLAFYLYSNSNFKGYYDHFNLAQQQHSKNKDPDKFTYIYADANFKIDSSYYYVFKNTIYTLERKKVIELKPNAEGFFVYQTYLYYAYGKEKQKEAITIAGPVKYTIKSYRFSRLNMDSLLDQEISKSEYKKRYSEVQNLINEKASYKPK